MKINCSPGYSCQGEPGEVIKAGTYAGKTPVLIEWCNALRLTIVSACICLLLVSCSRDNEKGWTFYLETPPPPEIVSIVRVIKNCEPPYPVSFKAVTRNLIGNITYNWDFGDGQTSSDIMPAHIYATRGKYKVLLTISNQIGSDTMSVFLPELDLPSLPVTAKYSYVHFNNNSFAPNKLIFTNSSTGANLFSWYFGDGGQSNNESPEYVFNNPGTYTVKLRGTCTNGSYNEYSQQVFIAPAPRRIFIDSINLMLPSSLKGNTVFIEFYHNTSYIGSTVSFSPSSYPVKYRRPGDFSGGYFFDFVQYTSNEVFKFVVYKQEIPPLFLYEILLSSVDIKTNFYPKAYLQVETVPALKDVFVDLYFSY